MKYYLIFVLGCLISIVNVYGQPGCPQIDAGADVILPCTQSCATLTANPIPSGQSNIYKIDQIPYNPFSFTGGTPIFVGQDDIWSDVISLPFTFCFFDNSYNEIIVGANGLISFDVSLANLYCEWFLDPNDQLPTPNLYTNTIMGPYQDIDPSLGGSINYQIIGSHPCRIFVVSYDVPMYESGSFLSTCFGQEAKQQIVIYETTNIIEVYIDLKEACPDGGFFSGWNDGLAVLGIQNAAGTLAYPVPGRNNTVWTANNEGWRWTPDGNPIYTVNWFEDGVSIGSGNSITVCPTSDKTYVAEATYLPCAGGTPVIVLDTLDVDVTGMTVSIDSTRNISCFGQNNGYVEASIADGIPPVTYSWIGSGNNNLFQDNLSAGTYIFTASDAGGCTRTDTVIISEPSQLSVNVPDTVVNICSGTTTGTITAFPQGGSMPYNYSWNTNPVQNTQTATGIPPGSYAVLVTDSAGCTATSSGSMSINFITNNLSLAIDTLLNVRCFDLEDGRIAVSPVNGIAPYTYNWNTNPQQSGATVTNLDAGTYTVTITDGRSCSFIDSFTITEPSELNVSIDSFSNVSCFALNDGYAEALISGGTNPYTTVWNTNPPQFTTSISNLLPGTYNIVVLDSNQCIAIDSVTITEPDSLFANIIGSQDASCYSYTDGSATVSASGGVPSYTYSWNSNPPQNNSTASNIGAGTYRVTVTDASGCFVIDSVDINQPGQVEVIIDSIFELKCFGDSTGGAVVSISGGNQPYTYSWSTNPNQTTNILSDVVAGNYELTVSDFSQCITVTSVLIEEPSRIEINPIVDSVLCKGDSNGAISLNVSGGTPDYNYFWSDSTLSGNIVNQLSSGNYSVTITDSNDCTDNVNIILEEPTLLNVSFSEADISCFDYNDGSIAITSTGGAGSYSYEWSNNVSQFATAEGLSPGNYTITVSDINGCDTIINAELNQPEPITTDLPDTFWVHYGNSVVLDNTISGGIGNLNFDWNPGDWLNCFDCQSPTSTPDFDIYYTYTVTDENECFVEAATTVLVKIDKNIYIPNIFSPNGDGLNDDFEIFARDFKNFEVNIFNRWGELVFTSSEIDIRWDGTFKGKTLPPDVFVYQVKIGYPDGVEAFRKGSLTLMR